MYKGNPPASPSRALLFSKIALQRSPDQRTLSALRASIPPVCYPELVLWMSERPGLWSRCMGTPFPKQLRESKETFLGWRPVGVVNEFRWLYASLMPFSKEINEFVGKRDATDCALLISDRQECYRLLDEIQQNWGLSYWLIKRKIAAL